MSRLGNDVYKWSFDADNYKTLYCSEMRTLLNYAHTPELKTKWGKSRRMQIDGPKKAKMPDIARQTQELPVLSRRALDVLGFLIPDSAQRLKVDCGTDDYWALNVLWTRNALIVDRSTCDVSVDGEIVDVLEGEFRRDAVDGEIFTVPRCLEVYVSGKFLNAVDQHGLKGLIADPKPMGKLV